MATKAIRDWLATSGDTDDMLARAGRLLALEHLYANCVPETLARASTVVNLKEGTLLLHARNGATASKLRQLAPSIVEAIRKRNQDVTRMQVTVRVDDRAPRVPAAPKIPVPESGLHQIEALTDSLPESSLKDALVRLAARQRTYLK